MCQKDQLVQDAKTELPVPLCRTRHADYIHSGSSTDPRSQAILDVLVKHNGGGNDCEIKFHARGLIGPPGSADAPIIT